MMSISRPAAPAVRAVSQTNLSTSQTQKQARQQQQQAQEGLHEEQNQRLNQHGGQQQQEVGSNHQSYQFACLYTHQKTQKRKKWRDGRFVLQTLGGRGSLYDADPAPGSGNPVLAEVELPRGEINSLLQRHQTTVEAEKYLIQLEGVWNSPTTTAATHTVSTSMQKLMKRKFQKPGAYKPPNPHLQSQQSRGGFPLNNRKRPLQPGELVRKHYGNAGGAGAPGAPPSQSYNQNLHHPYWQKQQGPPGHSLPAWNTDLGGPSLPNRTSSSAMPLPSSDLHLQQQRQMHVYPNRQQPQQLNSFNSSNQPPQQNQPQVLQGQGYTRSLGYNQQDREEWQHSTTTNATASNNDQQVVDHLHRPNSFSGGTMPPSNVNQANPSMYNYQGGGGASLPPRTTATTYQGSHHHHHHHHQIANNSGTSRSNKENGFVRNSFDPKSFYGLDDEEDEEEEGSDDEGYPFLVPSNGGGGRRSSNTNNSRPSSAPTTTTATKVGGNNNIINGAGICDDGRFERRQTGVELNSNVQNGANKVSTTSTTTAMPTGESTARIVETTVISEGSNQAQRLTNQDLLDIFGAGDDDGDDDDDDDDYHDQADKENVGKETNQSQVAETLGSTDGTRQSNDDAKNNNEAPEFTLPPVYSSSESSDDEDE